VHAIFRVLKYFVFIYFSIHHSSHGETERRKSYRKGRLQGWRAIGEGEKGLKMLESDRERGIRE
jgi:hypothetical protein